MGQGGRPRKPTKLKLLHGDDKKNPQRINEQEPVPQDRPVDPPFKLSKEAQQVWDDQIVPRVQMGVVTSWDPDAAAFFCEAVSVARTCVRKLRRSTKAEPGAPSPLGEFKKAIEVCAKLGGPLGWTPSDRAKLAVGGSSDVSEDDDLLTG